LLGLITVTAVFATAAAEEVGQGKRPLEPTIGVPGTTAGSKDRGKAQVPFDLCAENPKLPQCRKSPGKK
jgi:hypothetical protein